MREHVSEARGNVNNTKKIWTLGAHYNFPGHQISNIKVTIIEKVEKFEGNYRKERDYYQ